METQVSQKENKMGIMPVNRLLLSMSVPMMISMSVSYTHLVCLIEKRAGKGLIF